VGGAPGGDKDEICGDEMRRPNRCIQNLGLIVVAASVMLGVVAQELEQQKPPPQAPASNQRYETGTPNRYRSSSRK
jgi:hypothetical protein